jgi:hypothetical protein
MRQWKALIPVAALAVAITFPGIRLASAQSAAAVLEGRALMVVGKIVAAPAAIAQAGPCVGSLW